MSGTATQGSQYKLSGTSGTVTIPAGANSATVTLSVTSGPKNAKNATMTIKSGTGYTISSPNSATVSITK
jgi:hypothetical protein